MSALALVTSPSLADEGQWMPSQLTELSQLGDKGLALPATAIHNEEDGGLMKAVLWYSGCTASFVSPQGLIVTNHHCAYGDLQAQSTPEHDYLSDGFLAKTKRDELRMKSRATMEALQEITDVTQAMTEAMAGIDDHRARFRALEKKEKEIVAECEKAPNTRCRVASFYEGSVYQLHRFLELRDIRIVYAPPAAIGEYGGDVDNWMWPRHTGDFSVLRAYVGPDQEPADYAEENVPYRPPRHLEVSAEGVQEGDFVMIMGYPGSTHRHLPAVEVERYVEQVLPRRAEVYGEWVDILEAEAERGEAVAIRVAAIRKSLANRAKNARGMLTGVRRMKLLERKRARDEKLKTLEGSPEGAKHRGTMARVATLSQRRRAHFERAFLLETARRGPNLLPLAIDLVRRARERQKPDLERAARFMDRGEDELRRGVARHLRDYDPQVEAKLLASLVARSEGVGIPAFDELREAGGRDLEGHLTKLLERSKLVEAGAAEKLFDEPDLAALEGGTDPMVKLAVSLVTTIEAVEAEGESIEGEAAVVGPKWFALMRAEQRGPLYPDANRTLRFSYATVQGYAPRDGLVATPHTSLSGAIDKHTDREPFDLPDRLLAAAPEAANSYWAPPHLGDVPVCFLANGDTTGGNSGSPAVNGNGELVGLNFDRVWENIAGDFGYHPPRSRNIMVDIRYVLFLMDKVDDAGGLLAELGLESYRSQAPRPAPQPAAPAPSGAPPPPREPPQEKGGCQVSITPSLREASPGPWWLVGLGLCVGVARRRRIALETAPPRG